MNPPIEQGEMEQNPLEEIDKKLAILKGFETDLHNQEVEQARVSIASIIEGDIDWLNTQRMVATCHGSLQYNDPRNLDGDIMFITDTPGLSITNPEYNSHEYAMGEILSLPKMWPRVPFEPEFYIVNISNFEQMLSLVEAGTATELDVERLSNAGYVLSSALINSTQEKLFRELQQKVRSIAEGSKWLRESIIENLNNAITIRKIRRGLLPPETEE